jgi:hypothetical protein
MTEEKVRLTGWNFMSNSLLTSKLNKRTILRDPEQKNVEREGVKKAAVALRMAEFLIKVDEIFGDARLAGAEKVSPH